MCGIVGAVARRNVVPILIEGLRRLEYRGYDSAGVAVINASLQRIRSCGRVAQLETLARAQSLEGRIGIGHTRWATHGAPSERNAHPHVSGGVSVVHNGIIENHEAVRTHLRAMGYQFSSDTDTEVIAHLVHNLLSSGLTLFEAVQAATRELAGAYAIAVIAAHDPSRMAVARMGAPLLLGLGDGENFAASDTGALLQVTRRIVYLEEGDCADVTQHSVRVIDARGHVVDRPLHVSELRANALELGSWRHYMQKEIFEQPAAVAATLETAGHAHAAVFGPDAEELMKQIDSCLILACGTSYHAGLVARHWIEGLAGVPCSVEIASEYRYRASVPNPRTLVVAISQSGETADTIAAVQHVQHLGQEKTLAICNVPESALIRNCVLKFLTRAGPEIGVASTKAFTCQLAALLVLAISLRKVKRKFTPAEEAELHGALRRLPAALSGALRSEPEMAAWAHRFASSRHALFLGRGVHYPIAMEGALKLKEISYVHAEAYAAGELKHGPLALVDGDMPVIAIAPHDALLGKLKSNLQEVRARGGELYVLAHRGAAVHAEEGVHVAEMADEPAILSPIVATVPLQLLAYHAALDRGNDVDKPRNLAKSVTVE
ncbi:MAG: glutamine--fructose-6-phosphate aminotransferase [Moraxellaceae bacterium]|jgi:glucosamine--fructose-6-phosphate aminotransferase (isomerizing)|nr:glutamine--fructose-6-phosphate aminotransferase [Moraxellaceae bacterium]